ncbi:hypothetical protein BDP81DRAFT_214658 [Colletotrichum phormii]|uniref:Uncharacterized protein n=1 Tax=Colletotrichum phormii TaxID=359342 RepID=A0AAI9ZTG5_9PEZI|nr:uncharacterized protein BDP81DRAFT_214658 [Colletotrichum phormii]KAK1637861.1 hypothetical protein BDP81DRAFT_214658 [Colletotrichum phormii]
MSAPTLCIAPALPCLALPFPSTRTAPAQHISLQVPFPPIFAHTKFSSPRFPPFVLSLLRPLPCPSTRPGVQFHPQFPHHNRPAPSLPLPSPLSTLPTSHRFLPPNSSFPPTSHSHDSDPLLIRSPKGAEYSRSQQTTCAPSQFNPVCGPHITTLSLTTSV